MSHGLFVALALAAGLTLAAQLALNAAEHGNVLAAAASMLRYFTIWTNLAIFLIAIRGTDAARRGWRRADISMISAVTLFGAFVGLVYHLLLSDRHDPQGARWLTNLFLHYLNPAALVAIWWVAMPKGHLVPRDAVVWLALPLTYLAVSLIRGAMTGWYPYFFVDVSDLGYPGALINAAGLTAVFLMSGLALIWCDGRMARRPPARARQ